MTEKQILINQLLTDASGIDATGQEATIELVLNKIKKIKDIEDKEVEEAEKDSAAGEGEGE